jgi:hypothetical protein
LVVVVAAGEFGAEVEEAPWAREIEIRDPNIYATMLWVVVLAIGLLRIQKAR